MYLRQQQMKFILIVAGLTALSICHQTVRSSEQFSVEQLKTKIDQFRKKIDLNRDGHVSLDQLSKGLKKEIGLIKNDKDQTLAGRFYEKFLSKKNQNKNQYLSEEDIEQIFRFKEQMSQRTKDFLATAKETAQNVGEIISEKVIDAKEEVSEKLTNAQNAASQKIESIVETVSQAKNSASQKINDLKDSASKLSIDIKDFVQEKIKDFISSEKQDFQKLKQKAGQIFSKFDRKKDEKNVIQDLKGTILNSLEKQQDGNTIIDRVTQLFKKYVTSENMNEQTVKGAIFSILSDKNKGQNKWLQKIEKEAQEFFKKFDGNRDEHVSLEQIVAGVKNGLGIENEFKQVKDQSDIRKYAEELHKKYVKSGDKSKNWFTVEDFQNILGISTNKIDWQNIKKKSLKQLNAKINDIHQKLDSNKDGEVSFKQASEGLKEMAKSKVEPSTVFKNVKQFYDKYLSTEQSKKQKLNKEEFNKRINEWRQKCEKTDQQGGQKSEEL